MFINNEAARGVVRFLEEQCSSRKRRMEILQENTKEFISEHHHQVLRRRTRFFPEEVFIDLVKKNNEFILLLVKALQFGPHPMTALPSLIFLIFSMFVLHRLTHKRYIYRRSILRNSIYREIAFQWLYFYFTRFWIYIVKLFRNWTGYLEESLQHSQKPIWVRTENVYYLMFLLFLMTSFIPCLITLHNVMDNASQEHILMWITTNRWARTELGSSGRLMLRGSNLHEVRHGPPAYQTRRSTSAEQPPVKATDPRITKSLLNANMVSSIEIMVKNDEEVVES